ncbi:hypothetical protein M9H77_05143 [Catharanthus roseus]|uniref:Uncharacterized protein n=1 Tax=Catharanthus roseus TaxID=4058 RepID=A0ACC0CG54_CATRO|nr:hypothetical protein M9H77_05143 [Catharanthus roseus]
MNRRAYEEFRVDGMLVYETKVQRSAMKSHVQVYGYGAYAADSQSLHFEKVDTLGWGSSPNVSNLWNHIPKAVEEKILAEGFGRFINAISSAKRDQKLAFSLAERGGTLQILSIYPLEFTTITGIRVGKQFHGILM